MHVMMTYHLRRYSKNMETKYDVCLNTLCNYFVDINLALFFGDAEFPIMHTVPLFKKRRIFKRRLLENSPSNTQLWKWINAQTETVEGDGDASAPKASRWGGLSVDKVLKFLDATRLLRQLHEFKNARGKFRALEDALTDEPRKFEPKTEWNYESLRKARISIDGLWCLLFRQFWLTLPYEDIFLYVWIDSSPQFKGHELFSASFDLVVGSVDQFFMHRLYPQICISRGMYTRWGKVYAFLWQFFYVRVQVTRKYDSILLRSVGFVRISTRRSGLSTPPDCLIDFLRTLNVRIPSTAVRLEYLFPNALPLVGWHHCFDGLIRSGLCSIPWFTAFLVELKTFNRFLRDHKVDVADALEVAGLVGAQGLFLAIAFVTFAEWRWRKLARVCSALQKVFNLLFFPMIVFVVSFLHT